MIIYKYVDAWTLFAILESRRLMFSHPVDFNDPFDRPRVPRSHYKFTYQSLIGDETMTPERQAQDADEAWGRCAVTSFTRTPDNALMWAHYADKHQGAVIEIDADEAGLTDKSFLIPAQFGSVIYMKRPVPDGPSVKGLSAMLSKAVTSGDGRFDIDNYAGLQRLFLMKGLSWGYEEEVRVVSQAFNYTWLENGEDMGGYWKKIFKAGGKQGYGWRFNLSAVKKVFVGLRFKEIGKLCALSGNIDFGIMCPDTTQRNDYEVHFKDYLT